MSRRRSHRRRDHHRPDELPPAGLDGSYSGSCIICLQGTDTGVGFRGEAEWIAAAIVRLGVNDAKIAGAMVSLATGCKPGEVPDGITTGAVTICEDCFEQSIFGGRDVKPGVIRLGVPVIEQR